MAGLMTHSAADVVRWLLINLGHGTRPSVGEEWPISMGKEPSSPDDAITVYATEGTNHGRTMPDGERQGNQGIQVRVRSGTGPRGFQKALALATALDGVYWATVTVPANTAGVYPVAAGTYSVQSVRNVGDVVGIGTEAPTSERQIFVFNAEVTLKQTA